MAKRPTKLTYNNLKTSNQSIKYIAKITGIDTTLIVISTSVSNFVLTDAGRPTDDSNGQLATNKISLRCIHF